MSIAHPARTAASGNGHRSAATNALGATTKNSTSPLAMPLATPADPWPLVSIQRFVLALFPCFTVLGSLPIGPAAHRLLLALSAVAMVWLIVVWSGGDFVA